MEIKTKIVNDCEVAAYSVNKTFDDFIKGK